MSAPPVLAATPYVHDLDPVIFELGFGFAARWYGLAYVLGFFIGIALLKWLANRDRFVLPADKVSDFITYAFLLGVFLGGRVGYFVLYRREALIEDPLLFFRVTEGGMASHGGIFGLAVFAYFYAYRHRVSSPALGDGLVVVAPLGVALGRIANFINGELYGRITTSKWGMVFPDSLRDPASLGERAPEAWNAIYKAEPRLDPTAATDRIEEIAVYVRDNPALQEVLATYVAPRHPSQLYQAGLEGLLVFAVLFALRMRFKNLPAGLLTGVFFVLYAVTRIFGETFREPDAERILTLTRGQFYSTFMVVIGLAFIVAAVVKQKRQPSNPTGA